MPVDKFRFLSPAVLSDEIDKTAQAAPNEERLGPVIIGRTQKGPARPVTVNSFSDYLSVFGSPVAGGQVDDVWRQGNYTAPMYAMYGAQAWLKNNSPVTVVRVLGEQSDNAEAAGKAGWETDNSPDSNIASNGGAYGLFMIDSGSASTHLTGALAAIFYIQSGAIALSGSDRDGNTGVTGSARFIKSTGSDREFKALIYDENDTITDNVTFNFNKSSAKYIRKVFNTNPILTNTDIVASTDQEKYWLGETFDRHLTSYVTSSTAGSQFGVILALEGVIRGTAASAGDFRMPSKTAKSGWIFSQDFEDNTGSFEPRNLQKLFRFHSLYGGEWDSKNVKISIKNIKDSTIEGDPYGTFDVEVRRANDNDANPQLLESFSSLNLNPASSDFIARKIGDMYTTWDDTEKRYKQYGFYENNSRYIRVEVNDKVLNGMHNSVALPFGFYGPLQHKSFSVISGAASEVSDTDAQTPFTSSLAKGGSDIAKTGVGGNNIFAHVGEALFSGTFEFPEMALRSKATAGNLSDPLNAYFGVDTAQTAGSSLYDSGYVDYVRPLPVDYIDESEGENLKYAFMFTLDDISGSSVVNSLTAPAEYVSGSRKSGTSISATEATGWKAVLNNGHNRFTLPLVGGFDGFDITEEDPLRNSGINSSPTETNDYKFYSLKRAVDSIRDKEMIEYSLAAMPGITNEGLTGQLVDVCQERGDALAIIDPKGAYVPSHENTNNLADRVGTVSTIVDNMTNRGINSSFGAAYDPWVMIRDSFTGQQLLVPPSVVALGTMASSDAKTNVWFAPAGFTRGGLSEGSAGLNVVGVERHLSRDDRDDLYAANINPIAKFPAEGIVVYGQKTLQRTPSALDRINVRRLLIYVRKEIERIAKITLFEPNVRATWNRFKSKAEPLLKAIQGEFGLVDYKLIVDESTTTPDLIDRNIMYAKVLLKPTRTIEYIALDFSINDSGIVFE